MPSPIELRLDVSSASPEGRAHVNAAWLFAPPPEKLRRPAIAIIAVPGGGYSKAYYHMRIPGHPGYSFAEHLASLGYIVIAMDHLGVGESTRLKNGDLLNLDVMAAAGDIAARQIRAGLANGTLAECLPPLPEIRLVGMGHSMGGGVTVTQQANHQSFDALAIIGYTFVHAKDIQHGLDDAADLSEDALRARVIANVQKLVGARWDDVYFKVDRTKVHAWFHWPDVPAEVIAADDAAATTTPRMAAVDTQTPGKRAPHAAKVSTPLFIVFSERDVSPDPHHEASLYSGSPDKTLYILPRAGHCQNFASTRHDFWNRFARWLPSALP
ncbi:MAG: alpha/beta fold hydrolase [Caulobacterales bacterium]|nr:alpha/beta fold hydrolase [Caulobacterales bacterium]